MIWFFDQIIIKSDPRSDQIMIWNFARKWSPIPDHITIWSSIVIWSFIDQITLALLVLYVCTMYMYSISCNARTWFNVWLELETGVIASCTYNSHIVVLVDVLSEILITYPYIFDNLVFRARADHCFGDPRSDHRSLGKMWSPIRSRSPCAKKVISIRSWSTIILPIIFKFFTTINLDNFFTSFER